MIQSGAGIGRRTIFKEVNMTPENEAKENYLNRYKRSMKKLEEIDLEISRLRLGILPGAVNYDGMPHGSGGTFDLSDYAEKLDELLTEFIMIRERAIVELCEISRAVEAVTDVQSNILLRYHYIMLYGWDETADKMGYTSEYTRGTLKGKALRNFKIP